MTMGNQYGTGGTTSTGTMPGTTPGTMPGGTAQHSAQGMTGLGRDTGMNRRVGGARETKPFYRTSEFIVFIALAAVVIVAGYSDRDSLDLFRTWALVTALGAAYILSRGLAKAGSREGSRDDDNSIDIR
jgi:hypothetical protein